MGEFRVWIQTTHSFTCRVCILYENTFYIRTSGYYLLIWFVLLQERQQVGCEVSCEGVGRYTTLDNLAPFPEYSAYVLVPPHHHMPALRGFLRRQLLMICAAKPRYAAAAASEHWHVPPPLVPTSGTNGTCRLKAPRKVLFKM